MLVATNAILGNRRHDRFEIPIDIVIDDTIRGRVTNIGMGGLYATINKYVDDFTNHKLELILPDMSIFLECISLRTLVISFHCNHTAVCFKQDTLSDEDKISLEDFLEGRGRYDIRKPII